MVRGLQERLLLPIVLNETAVRIGLVGEGDAFDRRQTMLAKSGVTPKIYPADIEPEAVKDLALLFVAGLNSVVSGRLAHAARAAGVLVNVEDVPQLCDFHVPAAVRRGDLVVTVSTGGKAPGLASIMRQWLEQKLGSEWSGRLNELADTRAVWRRQGLTTPQVSQHTRDYVEKRNWLP